MCLCMCMHVSMRVFASVCVYVCYTCTFVYICVHAYVCVYICVYVCVCACICVCVCYSCTYVYICVHACGGQRSALDVFRDNFHFNFWGRISHWTSSLLIQQGWLANRPPRTQPHIRATGVTNTMPWIYMGVWDSNSGPYPFLVGISLIEPSPHPAPKESSKMWILRRRTCPRSLVYNAGGGVGGRKREELSSWSVMKTSFHEWKQPPSWSYLVTTSTPRQLVTIQKDTWLFWGFMYEKKNVKNMN